MIEEKQSNGLYRLLYVSRSSDAMIDAADTAKEIATVSEPNNHAKGLTGALVAHASWFVQVLEGSHEAITAVYSKIGQDRRHRDLQIVSFEPVEARVFPKWGMRAGRMKPSDFELTFDPSKMSAPTLMGLLKMAVLGFARARAA